MADIIDVSDMVAHYLKENGFDGLVAEESECGCLVDDLAPCSEMSMHCRAGYKHMHSNGRDWMVSISKRFDQDEIDRIIEEGNE